MCRNICASSYSLSRAIIDSCKGRLLSTGKLSIYPCEAAQGFMPKIKMSASKHQKCKFHLGAQRKQRFVLCPCACKGWWAEQHQKSPPDNSVMISLSVSNKPQTQVCRHKTYWGL